MIRLLFYCFIFQYIHLLSWAFQSKRQMRQTFDRRKAYEVDTETYLHAIRDEIMLYDIEHDLILEGFNHNLNYKQFVDDYWGNFTHDFPIKVISASLNHVRFGNNMGTFLTDIACANLAGLHVVIVDIYKSKFSQHYKVFFNSLPSVIVHPQPVLNKTKGIERYKQVCGDFDWPWVRCNIYLMFVYVHIKRVSIHIFK